MAKQVRLASMLRQHSGGKGVVEASGSTIFEILTDLQKQYPGLSGQLMTEDGKLHKFVNVYLNDDDVRYLDNVDTKVNEDDVISILPAVAGGA